MTSIVRALVDDYQCISEIGKHSVEEAHRESCSAEDMQQFLAETYNDESIKIELADPSNIYHLIYYNGQPAGFSKIILNAGHANISQQNVTKLDRIYLSKQFFGIKIGLELLRFNIDLAKANGQSGMWLFTWVGNQRAVHFYEKAAFSIIGGHRFKVTDNHYNEHHQMFLDLAN